MHLLKRSPTGPISNTCMARPSPTPSCGCRRPPSLWRRATRHVTRVGMQAASGGTRMRSPGRRRALTTAPRASTTKLIRNLRQTTNDDVIAVEHHSKYVVYKLNDCFVIEGPKSQPCVHDVKIMSSLVSWPQLRTIAARNGIDAFFTRSICTISPS